MVPRLLIHAVAMLLVTVLGCGTVSTSEYQSHIERKIKAKIGNEELWKVATEGAESPILGHTLLFDIASYDGNLAFCSQSLKRCWFLVTLYNDSWKEIHIVDCENEESPCYFVEATQPLSSWRRYLEWLSKDVSALGFTPQAKLNVWRATIKFESFSSIKTTLKRSRSERNRLLTDFVTKAVEGYGFPEQVAVPCVDEEMSTVPVYRRFQSGYEEVVFLSWDSERKSWLYSFFLLSPYHERDVSSLVKLHRVRDLIYELSCIE